MNTPFTALAVIILFLHTIYAKDIGKKRKPVSPRDFIIDQLFWASLLLTGVFLP